MAPSVAPVFAADRSLSTIFSFFCYFKNLLKWVVVLIWNWLKSWGRIVMRGSRRKGWNVFIAVLDQCQKFWRLRKKNIFKFVLFCFDSFRSKKGIFRTKKQSFLPIFKRKKRVFEEEKCSLNRRRCRLDCWEYFCSSELSFNRKIWTKNLKNKQSFI